MCLRLSCGFIFALLCWCAFGGDAQKIKIDVPADSINSWDSDVRIVGRTDLPLAKMCTIVGNWTYHNFGKDEGLVFHIMTVNGKPLTHDADYFVECVTAVDRHGRKMEPKKDTVWKMRAFETGKFDAGTPDEYLTLTGQKVPQATQKPFWWRPMGLELVGIVQ